MHQRFPTDEQQVADVVPHRDVDDVLRLLERDAAPLLGIKLIHGEPAEVALGVADIRDGELKIARPAMLKHFLEELPPALFRTREGCEKSLHGRSRLGIRSWSESVH